MEPTYTLWCNDTMVDEGMTEDEFVEELLDLKIDFSYTVEDEYYILYDNRYWYEVSSSGIL